MLDLLHRHGALLIFDEVKSGATIAAGGAIERYGVQPDLACFAKAIGGGTPAAAFGGRADVMEVIGRGAAHQGTFNGNPLVCAAGLAALTEVLTPDAYVQLGALGIPARARLRRRRSRRTASRRTPSTSGRRAACRTGRSRCATTATSSRRTPISTRRRIPWMVNRGLFMTPGDEEQWTLSVQHTEADIDRYVDAFAELCAALTLNRLISAC